MAAIPARVWDRASALYGGNTPKENAPEQPVLKQMRFRGLSYDNYGRMYINFFLESVLHTEEIKTQLRGSRFYIRFAGNARKEYLRDIGEQFTCHFADVNVKTEYKNRGKYSVAFLCRIEELELHRGACIPPGEIQIVSGSQRRTLSHGEPCIQLNRRLIEGEHGKDSEFLQELWVRHCTRLY